MARFQLVYLAGPDRHQPDSGELLARKRLLCTKAGLESLFAQDGLTSAASAAGSELEARELYSSALANLRRADAVIANLSPWRGPNCDPATAFEAGFASALAKPVFAYMNVDAEAHAELAGRVEAWLGASPDEEGVLRDADGATVEDYGLPEAALIWAEMRRLFVVVTPDPPGDLTGLELCLEAMASAYAD